MKGITQRLRDLAVGEQIEVAGVERSNIHHIASRVKIKVKIEKFIGGFLVTKVGEVSDDDIFISPVIKSVPVKVIVDAPAESAVEDDDWIEDPITHENGDILHWHHKPKCKPVCYKRESDLSGA